MTEGEVITAIIAALRSGLDGVGQTAIGIETAYQPTHQGKQDKTVYPA